jgi:hypothetical protein
VNSERARILTVAQGLLNHSVYLGCSNITAIYATRGDIMYNKDTHFLLMSVVKPMFAIDKIVLVPT